MAKSETAVFAGGCFWCLQPVFDNTAGVLSTSVGYTGGHVQHPSYQDVTSDTSGHVEAIQITFDPAIVSYETLLQAYWDNIDPTDAGGQFADRGKSYATVIFYADDAQRHAADASKKALEKSGIYDRPIVTRLEPAREFFPAEEYHQKYYQKNSAQYERYKELSGRGAYLKKMQDSKK